MEQYKLAIIAVQLQNIITFTIIAGITANVIIIICHTANRQQAKALATHGN